MSARDGGRAGELSVASRTPALTATSALATIAPVATPDDPVIEEEADKPDPRMDRSRDVSRLSRHSYLAGLAGVMRLETGAHQGLFASPILPVALLIVGANGLIAVLLPYSAENYPLRSRGRGSGWVAGASKAGGLIAQGLSLAALAPPLGAAAWLMAAPVASSVLLVALFGRETRGRALAETDSPPANALGQPALSNSAN